MIADVRSGRVLPLGLLIANRGEIAIRIAQAAVEVGVVPIGVYATDDAHAPHVAAVDSAVALAGEGPAAYLDVEDVLRAARESGVDAVHPGHPPLDRVVVPAGAGRCPGGGCPAVRRHLVRHTTVSHHSTTGCHI